MKMYQIIKNCTNGMQCWYEETDRYYDKLESAKRYCKSHMTYTGDSFTPYIIDGIYDTDKKISYYFANGEWKKEYGWAF